MKTPDPALEAGQSPGGSPGDRGVGNAGNGVPAMTRNVHLPPMRTAEEAAQWLREQITRRTHLIAGCEATRNENEKRFTAEKEGASAEKAHAINARWKEANERTAQNIARHDEIRSAYRMMLQWLTGEVWS